MLRKLQTPHERLKSVEDVGKYFLEGVTLEALDAAAGRQTDTESAARMQEARDRLFKKFASGFGPNNRPQAWQRHAANNPQARLRIRKCCFPSTEKPSS